MGASNNAKGLVLIICGSLLVIYSTLHKIVRWRTLSLDQSTVAAITNPQSIEPKSDTTAFYPVHIFIKWRVDVDIDPATIRQDHWTLSDNHASYLTSSARLGEKGNIVIYGHNKRSVLGNIRVLRIGDTLTITAKGGTKHEYRIMLVKQVKPNNLEYVQPTDHEVVTLYTCSGFMDSQRFIVRAEPISL